MHSRNVMCVSVAVSVLAACERPPTASTAPDASISAPAKVKEYWVSEFASPNPAAYGSRTFQSEDGRFTSRILGTETVEYTTGALTGVKIGFGDSYAVTYEEDRYLWMLGNDGWYLSTTCGALTAYPPSAILGKVHDGMILDMTGGETIWLVNGADLSQCEQVNTGYGDSYVALIQIQDIRLPDIHATGRWHEYKDALFMWALEPNRPDLHFQLDFGGVEDVLGIELPTAEEANEWAVDGFQVFGRRIGVLLMGEITLATGELGGITYLVPEPMARGGGTVDWTTDIRVTYGFTARTDADGNTRGEIQFNWHGTDVVWHGVLDCLAVDQNRAFMSGRVVSGQDAGRFLVFGVEDNGEGTQATAPDRISLVVRRRPESGPYDCAVDGPALARDWTNGNVQIR